MSYNELRIECIVCFEKIKKTNKLKICETCGNYYHKECLKKWWKKSPSFKNKCPTCLCKTIYSYRIGGYCCCF